MRLSWLPHLLMVQVARLGSTALLLAGPMQLTRTLPSARRIREILKNISPFTWHRLPGHTRGSGAAYSHIYTLLFALVLKTRFGLTWLAHRKWLVYCRDLHLPRCSLPVHARCVMKRPVRQELLVAEKSPSNEEQQEFRSKANFTSRSTT